MRPMVNNNDEARRALVERRRDKFICLSGTLCFILEM